MLGPFLDQLVNCSVCIHTISQKKPKTKNMYIVRMNQKPNVFNTAGRTVLSQKGNYINIRNTQIYCFFLSFVF